MLLATWPVSLYSTSSPIYESLTFPQFAPSRTSFSTVGMLVFSVTVTLLPPTTAKMGEVPVFFFAASEVLSEDSSVRNR